MKQSPPAIASHLFQAEPGLGAPAGVDIIICAVGGAAPDLIWDRVDEYPRCQFRPLAIIDIYTGCIPLNDVSPLVPQGNFALHHPAILAIGPPHARTQSTRVSLSTR